MHRGRYQQPWAQGRIAGARCLIQVLDPETAFALERPLYNALGDAGSLLIVTPQALLDSLVGALGEGTAEAISTLARASTMVAKFLAELDIDPEFAVRLTEELVLGRIKVRAGSGDRLVESWTDWVEVFGRAPGPRWIAVAVALQATFGPLWARRAYRPGAVDDDPAGHLPAPPGVSRVRMWADQLAAAGVAPSPIDVLTRWTPIDVIESVEARAFQAYRERVLIAHARRDQRGAGGR